MSNLPKLFLKQASTELRGITSWKKYTNNNVRLFINRYLTDNMRMTLNGT